MNRSLTEILKEKGICCISGKPLSTSDYINLVTLDYGAEWFYPSEINILHLEFTPRAQAAVHEDEMTPGRSYEVPGRCKFAIELRGEEIIYHPVENLKPIRYEI